MMTNKELAAEFWLLTMGVLQDARVDTDEARVIKRWLEEHQAADEFATLIGRLDDFLMDSVISPSESEKIAGLIGMALRDLRSRS